MADELQPLIWIIDKDHMADPSVTPPSNMNAVGMMGPSDGDQSLIVEGAKHEKFRMYDDDDELYYEGRIFGDYEGFEPLDDFGTPNAGAVHIKYWTAKPNTDKTLYSLE